MQIIISNNQLIEGLNLEQKNKIKDALTFDNPKYKQAKRYGRSKYISIPPYLTYYKDIDSTTLEVPFGYDVSKICGSNLDYFENLNKVNVDYPDIKISLREDQQKAMQGFLSFKRPLIKENHYGIIQLPTGKGKTILAIFMAHYFGQKTLILVHKDDLVVGWKADISKCFDNKVKVGLIKAKSRTVGEQFTIATVQTLSKMSEEELSNYTNQFGMIIQDECLTGDTLVVKKDGSVVEIPYIYNNCNVIGGKVSHFFSRESRIYQLNCRHAIIKGSPTHKTWCVRNKKDSYYNYGIGDFEVKKIEDLNSDYLVPVIYKIPHTTRNNVQPYYAKFCAMIMCDGHLDKLPSRRIKVNVTKDRRYYRSIFEEFCDNTPYTFKHSLDCRRNLTLWCNDESLKNDLITTWGIDCGKKSSTIKVPEFMYSAPLDTIKAFIETCFNCEGDLSIESQTCRYNFNTCSYQFAQGLSMLLKKFGILCNILVVKGKKENHNDIYRLSVGGYFFNVFSDTFTLIPRKTTTRRNSQNSKTNKFLGDFYLSPVKSVEDLDYEDTVYDFEVSKTNTFIANGLVTHNCHHVGANSFNIVDKFNCYYKIGLSATPTRTDGLNQCFDLFFGGVVYRHQYSKDDKDILPVEVRVKETKAKYRPFVIRNSQGEYATDQFFNVYDYKVEDLPSDFRPVDTFDYKDRPRVPHLVTDNAVVLDRRYKIMVCKDIINEVKQGHSCLVLFTQKEHINKYYNYLCRYIPESSIIKYYGDSKDKSEVLLKKAESKEALITLGTLAKATEGTNVKSWEVLFLVSSMNNEKNVEQATGRIRRSKEGKLNPVIVYDYKHPYVYGIQSHFNTRLSVYKKLKYDVKYLNCNKGKERGSLFSRGY